MVQAFFPSLASVRDRKERGALRARSLDYVYDLGNSGETEVFLFAANLFYCMTVDNLGFPQGKPANALLVLDSFFEFSLKDYPGVEVLLGLPEVFKETPSALAARGYLRARLCRCELSQRVLP